MSASRSSSRAASTPNCAPTTPTSSSSIAAALGDIERLQSHDIADTVGYIVTRPRHVAVAELLVRPTEQA